MLGLSVVEVWLKPKNAGVTKRNIINVFSNVAVKFGCIIMVFISVKDWEHVYYTCVFISVGDGSAVIWDWCFTAGCYSNSHGSYKAQRTLSLTWQWKKSLHQVEFPGLNHYQIFYTELININKNYMTSMIFSVKPISPPDVYCLWKRTNLVSITLWFNLSYSVLTEVVSITSLWVSIPIQLFSVDLLKKPWMKNYWDCSNNTRYNRQLAQRHKLKHNFESRIWIFIRLQEPQMNSQSENAQTGGYPGLVLPDFLGSNRYHDANMWGFIAFWCCFWRIFAAIVFRTFFIVIWITV